MSKPQFDPRPTHSAVSRSWFARRIRSNAWSRAHTRRAASICAGAAALIGAAIAPRSTLCVELVPHRTIAPGDSSVVTFALAPTDTAGLALEFDARMQATSFAGSNLVLRILLNGHAIDQDRILDKPLQFATANGKLLTWADGDRWRLVYSPGIDPKWNAPGDPHQVLGVSPFRLRLRVADWLRAGPNRLVLQHLGRKLPAVEIASLRLVSVGTPPARRPSPEKVRAPTSTTTQKPTAMTMHPLARGGAVELAVGSVLVPVETEISISGGGWLRLGREPSRWDRLLVQNDQLEAQAPGLRVRRTQRLRDGFLEVRDVLVNRTSSDLAVIVREALRVHPDSSDTYLGGIPLPPTPLELSTSEPQSPSAVAVAGGFTLGLLPGNDVLWVHASTYRDRGGIGLLDDQLCIAPRDSVALVWRALICPGSYDDWINAARAGLGANFTLEGGFAFGSFTMSEWPQARLRDWIRVRALRFLSSPGPTQSGGHGLHGPALLDSPEAQEKMRRFAAAVHATAPEVRVLAYFHAYITNRAGAESLYAGTRQLGPSGKPVVYPYKDRPQAYPLFVPIQGSRFARDLELVISKLWELGFDGLYWDEMSTSVTLYTYGGKWDGASGELDSKSQRLVRRKSAVPLLAQPWIETQLSQLASSGHVIVANTEPVTPSLMRYRFPRFVETPESQRFALTQLWSPVGLADRNREHTPADIAARIRDHLEHGALYYFYLPNVQLEAPTLASYMFPATPVRIQPGVFEAAERILTTRSGRYGWGDDSGHEVHVFAADGHETQNSFRTSEVDGVRWTELSLQPGESAAIVRARKP